MITPSPITIDGRSGVVLYLNADFEPVEPADATLAKVVFNDGGRAFYRPQQRPAEFYSPDQPREPEGSSVGGRWAGGDEPWHHSKDEYTAGVEPYSHEYYQKKGEWEQSVLGAVSTGQMTPEESQAAGLMMNRDEEKGWRALPPDLYHVTTAAPLVEANGLKSRFELNQGAGHGLGGGNDKSISFTEDPKIAEVIRDAMIEAHNVASGKTTAADLVATAREQGFLDKLNKARGGGVLPNGLTFEVDAMSRGVETKSGTMGDVPDGPGWVPSPHDKGWPGTDKQYYNTYERPITDPAERNARAFDLYKTFSAAREWNGGKLDPLFFGSDVKALAAMDPARDVKVMHFKPTPGARGHLLNSLGEWRTYSGKAVKLVKP